MPDQNQAPMAVAEKDGAGELRRLLAFGLLLLLMLALMLSLARWQWLRAAEKRTLQDAAQLQRKQPVLQLSGAIPDQLPRYRHVRIRGHWRSDPLFLDNQIMHGRAGYQIIMAFEAEGDQRWLLVRRGWMIKDFSAAPRWSSPSAGMQTIDVEVAPWPSPRPLLLQGATVQGLERAAQSRLWGRELHPLTGQELSAGNDGLLRQWPAPGAEEINKHLSYAGQWLLFSIVLLGVYVFYVSRYWRSKP